MDLRTLPDGLNSEQRVNERRKRVENELNTDLSRLVPSVASIGHADEKNCEQMIGHVPLPVGIAGPLKVRFGNKKAAEIYLPLATTEGALIASTNRGCKAVSLSGGAVIVKAVHHGMSRSIAFRMSGKRAATESAIRKQSAVWKKVGEATSNHLKILDYVIDVSGKYLFLTISCDTDQAMGMNMTTLAAQAIADWVELSVPGLSCVTVAGNVDSDKKPSRRTHVVGRGYEVTAEVTLPETVIVPVLKTTSKAMLAVADAKLKNGSKVAGAIGANLHAANIVAALYLATGQDGAHVVEGSLADTTVKRAKDGLTVRVRMPAILVGVRGGGTTLPAQAQCLALLLKEATGLSAKRQLAECVAAGVLAGEISLLAAQAAHTLAKAHKRLGR
ncbi:MAG TPA: 3-hydroxy-3-methylglutaryl-CoA reductase [Candidatus Peribacteria bacterium]|nr:3-hydroxy-3-methylglutaryl-CoA reductase [Candidatus Peribacteria bacterium]